MFAVIFKATARAQDSQYSAMAASLRQLAFEKFRCRDFIAVTEGEQEIAISYWDSEADIEAWKQESRHLMAQKLGQDKWYSDYTVEVVEIKRRYQSR
ncbi:antibiotic biosynthesis monooxygenase family protein [Shewanella khirikhana]|uniref:Antibiotic biosynthesis monooxygenase n=1 Tax=Shewanella khirikhana TaxID=1965282 RepID=A0ABM7CZ28_9GAMM|nr:antibiotic biosynthesis monooxygenase [Shewanella khirikhana]AZQ09368.1 hypothetical protein STH12_00216 [Shewanella khirikhana]